MANVIIRDDKRRARQEQILRDFGCSAKESGQEAREQAELIAEKCYEAVKKGCR